MKRIIWLLCLLLFAAKCSDAIYAFCKVGIPVWVQSDHVRRDGQGTRTHFPSVATPQSSPVVSPQLQVITVLLTVSHCDFYFDKRWHLFCFSFPLRHFLPLLAPRHSTLSPPRLLSSWDVRRICNKLWNLRIWRYLLTLQGCICIVPCYLLLYYYSYNINLLTSWYMMPFP